MYTDKVQRQVKVKLNTIPGSETSVGSVRLPPIRLEEMLMYLKSPTPIREIFLPFSFRSFEYFASPYKYI